MDNRFFTCPHRLFCPVVLENPSPPPTVPAQISPLLPSCSERLQSRANSSANQTTVHPSTFSTSPTLPLCSDTASRSSTASRGSNSLLSGRGLLPPPPSHRLLSSKTRQTSLSQTMCPPNQSTLPSIRATMASRSSTFTGRLSPPASPQYSPSSWPWSSLRVTVTSGATASANSRTRHTVVLRSIVAGATRNVSTHQRTQSGAYPGYPSPDSAQASSTSTCPSASIQPHVPSPSSTAIQPPLQPSSTCPTRRPPVKPASIASPVDSPTVSSRDAPSLHPASSVRNFNKRSPSSHPPGSIHNLFIRF